MSYVKMAQKLSLGSQKAFELRILFFGDLNKRDSAETFTNYPLILDLQVIALISLNSCHVSGLTWIDRSELLSEENNENFLNTVMSLTKIFMLMLLRLKSNVWQTISFRFHNFGTPKNFFIWDKLKSYDILYTVFDPNLESNLRLHYVVCDSFVLSLETEILIGDLNKLKKTFVRL